MTTAAITSDATALPPVVVQRLVRRFVRMFKCDTARITQPCGTMFLVVGHKRHTKRDRKKNPAAGQWMKDGKPFDFDYVAEQVIAHGKTEAELVADAKHYKKLQGMTMEQYLKSLCAPNDEVELPR
jgi:hypothetical protein